MPLDWAKTQLNLGNALHRLGEREGRTERLEEAVSAYRAALEEFTRDQEPLEWGLSTGNQGVVLILLAERCGKSNRAQTAVQHIENALVAMQDIGGTPATAYYMTQLPKAQALLDRLTKP